MQATTNEVVVSYTRSTNDDLLVRWPNEPTYLMVEQSKWDRLCRYVDQFGCPEFKEAIIISVAFSLACSAIVGGFSVDVSIGIWLWIVGACASAFGGYRTIEARSTVKTATDTKAEAMDLIKEINDDAPDSNVRATRQTPE